MQSAEDLARLAIVDRELIEMSLQGILDRLRAMDLNGLLTYFADDVAFELIGNWSIFPRSGQHRGKDAWAQALTAIYTNVENLGSEVNDIVIDGDRAAVRRTTRLRNYGTGRVGDVAIVDFLRYRDGLVVEVTEIVDSLAIARLEGY
jgi:ketosteroid isomerase-like protein